MKVSTTLSLLAVVLAVYISEVKGLDCIVCSTSPSNSDCDNGETSFDKAYKKSFPSGCKCSKSTKWYKDGRDTEVSRGCMKGYDVGCAVRESYLGYKEEFCVCDEDECNASSSLSISMFALMTSSLLAVWKLL